MGMMGPVVQGYDGDGADVEGLIHMGMTEGEIHVFYIRDKFACIYNLQEKLFDLLRSQYSIQCF